MSLRPQIGVPPDLKASGKGPRVSYSGMWAMCSAFKFFEGGWTNSRVALGCEYTYI